MLLDSRTKLDYRRNALPCLTAPGAAGSSLLRAVVLRAEAFTRLMGSLAFDLS